MASRETGKERSQRIQMDYYRHRGGLFWLRWACILAGLVGASVYTAFVVSPGGDQHVSTGPVATVHASFEQNCQQCHQDFTPLADDAFRIHPDESIQRTEQACQVCHGAGDHHRSVLMADWKLVDQNCSHCHADHQGRDHELTAVANERCVQCHADVSSVCNASHVTSIRNHVERFTLESHGDFTSLQIDDPGQVKFDHRQHLLPGQVDAGTKGGFTIEMLEASLRNRYRLDGQTDRELVQLDCASCHQLAGNPDPQSSLASDAEIGRYMKPISFNEHCSACHSMNPPGRTEDTIALPHAAPWAEIELLLQTKIMGQRIQGVARSPGDDSQITPLPGEGLGSARGAVQSVLPAEVAVARRQVEMQCQKCHDEKSITDQAILNARAEVSALIPPRWLRQGLYDHAAHWRIDCRYCHAAAYPTPNDSPAPPGDHEQVMISGIESCVDCHRPADAATPANLSPLLGRQPTWAADDCTLCHRYHGVETGP